MVKVIFDGTEYIVEWNHQKANSFGERETQCYIKNGLITESEGIATCSKHDNYNKKIGRKLSMARALNNMNLNRHGRGLFWSHYEKSIKF